ncbi:universal stress protein [Halobaculum sp. D14]|uniref:universal stress protein n=1 Tax=unclassified Halobaculum TaxID=2640896 RepID=UPI003EBCCEA5
MYDDILLPADGSTGVDAAIPHANRLAEAFDATVHVLYVADTNLDSVMTGPEGAVDVLVEEGERVTDDVADDVAAGVDVVTEVLQGDPYRTIVDYVDEFGIDLVVMATHGREGLNRFLLGSVTERVVRTADAPVLTVRHGDEA